jgi:hypothetical protein
MREKREIKLALIRRREDAMAGQAPALPMNVEPPMNLPTPHPALSPLRGEGAESRRRFIAAVKAARDQVRRGEVASLDQVEKKIQTWVAKC